MVSFRRYLVENVSQCDLAEEDPWTNFSQKLEVGLDTFIPMVNRKFKLTPPWLTSEAKNACNLKRRHFRKFLKTKSAADLTQYKKSEKYCKKTILKSKKAFERRVAQEPDKRSFSYYVKSKNKRKDAIGPLKNNDQLIYDPKEMSTILNNYFASVFTNDVNEPSDYPEQNNGHVMSSCMITPNIVAKYIDKLRNTTSKDPNGYSNRLLKDFKNELKSPLSKLFNASLNTGVVPNDWKIANVMPIFKKGQKSLPSNYRPVSLTSVICKLFERILQGGMVEHLERNNLLKRSQHGFRSRLSCATNLITFLEYTTGHIDNGIPIDAIYYDFSKAFDKVPIRKLMKKVYAYGIRGKVYKWIEQWLTDRRQRTVIEGECSEFASVLSGVPQGSVLGPLLFIIFIDDIDASASDIDHIIKFADDTKTINRADTIEGREKLQDCINRMFDWSNRWSMTFNVPKCKVVHFGHNNPCHNYVMNGTPIEKVENEKDIGVNVCSNLKPSDHCARAAGTAMGVLYQLLRSFHYRDKLTFVALYKTYVRPHLEFAVPAWNPWLQKDILALEKVQRKFVKNVTGLRSVTYEERLIELNMFDLATRRVYLDLVETYKIIKGITRLNREDIFELISDSQHRPTRSNDCPLNIVIKRSRLDIRRNFFSARVAEQWNSLPTDLKEWNSLNMFKGNLKSHLKHAYLDTRVGDF